MRPRANRWDNCGEADVVQMKSWILFTNLRDLDNAIRENANMMAFSKDSRMQREQFQYTLILHRSPINLDTSRELLTRPFLPKSRVYTATTSSRSNNMTHPCIQTINSTLGRNSTGLSTTSPFLFPRPSFFPVDGYSLDLC